MEMVIGSTSYRNKLLPTIISQSQRLAVLARLVLDCTVGTIRKQTKMCALGGQNSSDQFADCNYNSWLSFIYYSDRFYIAE